MIDNWTQSEDRHTNESFAELVSRVHCSVEVEIQEREELRMSEFGIRGIDLFKIAGESISGWIPSWKLGGQNPPGNRFVA